MVFRVVWLLLIVLLGVVGVFFDEEEGRREFIKMIKKEFDISFDGMVEVLMKYGKVEVNIWDCSCVKIEV